MPKTNLVIVGAGGFALELIGYFEYEQSLGKYKDFKIKGIIDDSFDRYKKLSKIVHSKYLGKLRDYKAQCGDIFWIAIGSQPQRKEIAEEIYELELPLFTFISSLAFVNKTAKIGVGSVIAPFCIINANVSLGKFALMNSYSAIGHDSVIGEHATLYPYAAINGNCVVGNELIMGTRATIFPGIKVGNRCIVTTHSYIKSDKPDNRFVHLKAKEVDVENRL